MSRFFVVFFALVVSAPLVAAEPVNLPPQVKMINEAIEQGWRDFEIRPSPEADDLIWCRRVFLDVIGRIPTSAELREFANSKELSLIHI